MLQFDKFIIRSLLTLHQSEKSKVFLGMISFRQFNNVAIFQFQRYRPFKAQFLIFCFGCKNEIFN